MSTPKRPKPKQPRTRRAQLPACILSMQCYCAGHARGNAIDAPCDTREVG